MYKVPVEVHESMIDGKGIFARADIKKDWIVWQFVKGHDKKMSKEEFSGLDKKTSETLKYIAYLSPTADVCVMPPLDDAACYTNHDPDGHNISVVFDRAVSDEPIFMANRYIRKGEEITNNYLEFDDNSNIDNYEWLRS